MKQYLDLLQDIFNNGVKKTDRTGTGTLSVFTRHLRFDLEKGFPVVTTKKVNYRAAIVETLWFLSGSTNIKQLNENGVHIWDDWADENGDLGPTYGQSWRGYGSNKVDQITNLIEGIKTNPDSRRHVVFSYNPDVSDQCRLPPCHVMFQCYVSNGKVSLHFTMRSSDVFLGLPFNLINYAIKAHMIAHQCGLEVGELSCTLVDAHIYLNHIEQVKLQLSRQPYPLTKLMIWRKPKSIFDYKPDDFSLLDYKHHEAIKAPIAI